MTTYYEVQATIQGTDNTTEILFGSFVKADCTYEIEAEKSYWRSEGYKQIKIITRETTDTPDQDVYTQEELNSNDPEREPVGHDLGVTVLHATNTRDSFFFGHDEIYSIDDAKKAWLAGSYDYVASLNLYDLDDAYQVTQNITTSWIKSKRVWVNGSKAVGYVAAEFDDGARSSSVGDIFLISNEDGKTEAWIVAGCGFTFGWVVTSATIMESTGASTARQEAAQAA